MMEIIRSKNKNLGGPSYYIIPGSIFVNMQDLWFYVRDEKEFKYEKCQEDEMLMACLKQAEYGFPNTGHKTNLEGSVDFLNRVIRGGGFVEYIKELECKII